jgi:hypothetical protein
MKQLEPATEPAGSLTLTTEDLRLIHEHLPYTEARNLKLLIDAMREFIDALDKERAQAEIHARLHPHGIRGLSLKSLYRKASAIKQQGWRGVVDGRVLRKLERSGLAANKEFCDHWHNLVAANQRKTAPAWRELLNSIHRGDTIPGLGTWLDIWHSEHPGITAPSICPYGTRAPYDRIPQGMSYTALMRLQPTAFGITASRIGTMRAATDYLPDVLRTRVGLRRCQVIQIDDMWDNAKVMFGSNRFAERVVELSAVDVLTGKIICHLSKPILRRQDNTRQVLRSEWTRYIIAHIICNLGYPGTMLIMGEHGTATIGTELRSTLSEISGETITFGAGGMLSEPLAKGLYDGRPKGNPQYKGLIECIHSLKQNEMATIKGQIGSRDSMDNEPENLYGMDKQQLALAAAVTALAPNNPGIQERLAWPWLQWTDYAMLKEQFYNAINNRTWHKMEGWEECGFIAAEWRPSPEQPWMPISSLDALGAAAPTIRAQIANNPQLFRTRRMSPDEAWHQRAGEVKPLEDWAAPLIMGEQLARICQVSDKLEMTYKDPSTMSSYQVYALINGIPLERRAQYKVWINPCDASKAYVADMQGRYIGIAPVAQAACHDDLKAIQKSLGVRQKALSAEVDRLRPVAHRRLREQAADARRNSIEILGYDPAETGWQLPDSSAADKAAEQIFTAAAGRADDDIFEQDWL